jgi:hypothetical protein
MAEAGFVIIGCSARIVPDVVEAAQRGRNDFRIQNHLGLQYVFQNVRTIPQGGETASPRRPRTRSARDPDVAKRKTKHANQNQMWEAARLYGKEADKCQKARAYFMAVEARRCELEALLRIFDFVKNRRPKDRCYNLNGLIDRAFKRHWIPHDALRHWRRSRMYRSRLGFTAYASHGTVCTRFFSTNI